MTRTPVATSLLLALLLAAPGCATLKPPELPARYWPPPPDPPRVEYEDRIEGSRWIQRHQRGFVMRERLGAVLETLDFIKPYDVAVGADGRVFVSDTGRTGVVVLDPERSKFGLWAGEGQEAIGKALGLEIDAEGLLYVSDAARQRVSVLDGEGKVVRQIGGPEQLIRPSGVAVDTERDRVYVVDVKGHDVEVFDRQGQHLQTIGQRGTADGEFNLPTWAAVGPDGTLYVADTMNFRVQRFNAEGSFLDQWGEVGRQAGYFNRVKGIDVDSEGRLWAVDASYGVIQIFDSGWRLLLIVSEFGADPGDLNLPAGIHVTDDGRAYVASQIGRTIEVFKLLDDEERRTLLEEAEAAGSTSP